MSSKSTGGKENVHFSSKTDDWATPQDFYDKLDAEFHFDLDACASAENAKHPRYYSENSLECDWEPFRVFMNPPLWPRDRKVGKESE